MTLSYFQPIAATIQPQANWIQVSVEQTNEPDRVWHTNTAASVLPLRLLKKVLQEGQVQCPDFHLTTLIRDLQKPQHHRYRWLDSDLASPQGGTNIERN